MNENEFYQFTCWECKGVIDERDHPEDYPVCCQLSWARRERYQSKRRAHNLAHLETYGHDRVLDGAW